MIRCWLVLVGWASVLVAIVTAEYVWLDNVYGLAMYRLTVYGLTILDNVCGVTYAWLDKARGLTVCGLAVYGLAVYNLTK